MEIIKEKDEKRFIKALTTAIKKNPNAKIHYSASQGTGIGGSASLVYTALLIYS
jgi:hypothetical protein